MAFHVVTGSIPSVTSDPARRQGFSAQVLNLRSMLAAAGAEIVRISIHPEGVDIDWLPAGADPELDPQRSSLVRPGTFEARVLQAIVDDIEIPVVLDAPALASLEAWRAQHGY